MIVSQNPNNENLHVKLGTYNFSTVEDCIYLGTIVTNKTELRPKIEKRVTNANSAYYALLSLQPSVKYRGH